MNYCKLTNQNLQTYLGFQWVIGEWEETSGKGKLCSEGWLHCYTHPLLAVFLNPIHANIENPKLFEIEVGGKTLTDHGLKVGFTRMRLTREIPLPQITKIQKIAFGILCAKEVVTDKNWLEWADNWLNGTDRTEKSAQSAVYAASTNASAAFAAARAAAYATYYVTDAVSAAAHAKSIDLTALAQKAITFN